MYNSTLKKLNLFKLISFVLFFGLVSIPAFAQVCGTPGGDGPVTVSSSINTYFPISGNVTLNAGAQSIVLAKVPATDQYSNNFGTTQISVGDLILIIQMQDATIDYSNTTNYGSGTSNSGADGLGGTGFTSLGNTGVFEYVIATNSVPLTGGNLTFKGTGPGGGVLNSFYNADATTTRGKRTFQIVRVPQYSNLTLTSSITTPPFNGIAGGVIAFNVSGTFNFAGFSIDGNARGFRGGYSPIAPSNLNNATTYVGLSSDNTISGKGEGIAGTPRYMWDGFNQVDNIVEGMPGGSSGRGAPANAGGGGNDHNSGGGGGGNGGLGGLGGAGWQGGGGNVLPLTGGGRPGFRSYLTATPFPRLVMGGGGGAGDANNASSGVKGGVGGAIILINAGTVQGTGNIYANGGKGAPGAYSGSPDGAGGGGAGGTVLLNITNSSTATIRIEADGGAGGNTENDNNNSHGPGGGGGGGIIRHNLTGTVALTTTAVGGVSGKSNAGNGITNGAIGGTAGSVSTFTAQDVPPNLQVNSNCFPVLETKVKALATASACNSIGEKVSYEIQIKNTGAGNAAGVALDFLFPTGIEFDSATATYSAEASGPSGPLANTATANNPLFGNFNIAQNGVVTITLTGKVAASMTAGTYSANAQALYLDPTRTTTNPNRKITAFTNAYGAANKTYEGASQANVPGTNFKGSGETVDDITILALPATPTTTVIQSTCATPTGTITVNTPVPGAGISYTIRGTNPVTAPVNNTTGVFSGLVPNTYVLTTTNAQGCTSAPTSGITINSVAGAPTTTGVSICQGGSGTLTATSTCSGSAAIEWYVSATATTPIFTGSSFNPVGVTGSGLANTNTPGTTTYYAACPGASSCRTATNFVINAIPTITGTTPAARCDAGSVTLGAAASSGTINWYAAATGGPSLATGASFITPNLSVTTTYYVDATANGCTTGTRTAVVATINTRPTIDSTTQDSRCGTGTLTLTATASSGATINWYANSTGGTSLKTGGSFTTPSLSTTTTYYVEATSPEGCTSASRVAVAAVVNSASTITFTSGTQNPTVCSGTVIPSATYTFGGSATNATASNLPAGLSASVDTTAKTITISGTPTASGTYTITTVGHTAPCTPATITGTVTANSTPAPTLSTITQPTCSTATGSFTISNYSGSNIYTITPSTGVIRTGNSVTAPQGSYTIKATANGCDSGNTAFIINAQPSTPATPTITPTAATCSAAGSSVVSNYNSGLTYIFTPTGPSVGAGGAITGMVVDTDYTLTARNSSNCTSAATAAFRNNAMLATPATPTITPTAATCSAAGSSVVSNYNSGLTYTFTPTGPSVGAGGAITGMVVDTDYTLTARNSSNCTSAATAAFRNNAMLATPATPTITPTVATCSAAGSSVVSNYNSGLTYTFTPTGPSVGAGGAITGMVVDTDYTLTARNSSNCTSAATAAFRNNAMLATPATPTITPTAATCSAAGSSVVSNYNSGLTYTFTPTGPSVGAGGAITGMVVDTDYTLTARNASNCTSAATAAFRNNAMLATPATPTITPTAATCSAAGSSVVSNYNSGLTYTFTPTGPSVGAGGAITGMVVDTDYTLTARNSSNCTSAATAAFRNNAMLATPATPTITPTAATCSAAGSSVVSNYNSGLTYTFTPTGPSVGAGGAITGMVVDTDYTLTARNASNCTSAATAAFRNNAMLATPATPTITPTAATCSAAGSSVVSNYNSGLTYTFTPTGPSVGAGGAITGMVVDTDYTLTARNASNCTSAATAAFRNNAMLATPATPTITPTAATCSAAGSSVVSNYNSGLTYTFTPTGPSVGAGGAITGMVVDTDYTLTARNASNCTSAATAAFRNNAMLATPATPTITPTAATCSAAGSSVVSNYNSGLTYTFTPTGPSVGAGGAITGMVVDTDYTLTARNASNCTSAATAAFRNNAMLATPATPTITPTAATCSAAGSSVVSNYNSGLTYTFTPTGPSVGAGGAITGMVVDTDYTLTARNASNCTSAATAAFRNNAMLATPATPLLSAVTQPTCTNSTGSFIITNYNASYTYIVTPSTGVTQNGDTVTAPEGSYTLEAILGNCKSSPSSNALINAQPMTPAQPILSSVTQLTCSSTTGSFTIINYNSTYTYIVSPSFGVIQNGDLVTAPAGNYTIRARANGCESTDVSVIIDSKICANTDNTYPTQVPGTTVATTVGNVTSNDTLNGQAVTAANTNVTPITTGPLSIDANGVLTLAPNTVSGTYQITYEICEEGATPANCATATATVVVGNPIVANTDNTYPTQVPGTTAATTVGNVTTNDTLNGQPVTAANTNVTAITTGPLSIDANGVLTLAPNTVSGTYQITYEICEEGATPANCATATATVVVGNPIVANTDNTYPTQVPGTTAATTVGNVTTNDTLNGQPVTAANTNVTPITAGPLSIDANGVLTLAPNTVSGTYQITYEICEEGAVPANCATATATVVVGNPLVANTDNTYPTQVPGTTAATTVGNVTTNDTLNGQPVTAANTNVTPITTGPLSIDANGVLTLAPNTVSGTYQITYEICEEGATPANCATATATVVVGNPIVANTDNTYPTQVSGTTVATTVGNVTTNDTLNGQPVTAANTNVTPITAGPLSIDANGVLTLAPNTVSGTYQITYEICEEGATPANCATATATVVVGNPIVANTDNTYPTQVSGTTVATTVGNVTTNDTLNGQPVTAANTNVTPITTGTLSIDANGVLTLAPNTVSGTYQITYEICEEGATPANCATATATVVVGNPIVANTDNNYPTQVSGTTVATTVGNVTSNDTLNGQPVTAANTNVTPITTGPLSIDANGVLTLAPNTVSGTYQITYEICEEGATPANCATATATVVVGNPLVANTDNTYPTQVPSTTAATTVGNVTTNDTLNGQPVTAANTNVTPITTGPLSIDANGVLTLAPNTVSGTYQITYEICEEGATPANCATATATVVVGNPLVANTDNTYPTQVPSTTAATTVGNVTTNDTLNGQPVTAANTNVTPITTGPLSIDANGVLTLAPNTVSGTYQITYEICEEGATPANCATATATVVVGNPLVANTDNTYPTQVPGTTVATTVGNVTTNDTLNGQPVTAANTNVTPITTGPLSIDANGVLTLAPNTVSGTYQITYEICEEGAVPANCATATATVVVGNPIVANTDNTYPTQVSGTTVATTVGNVTTNDTLNGQPVTAANTNVTPITTGPLSIDANGVLTLAPNTVSGTYQITYEICEEGATPANCATATATVVVGNPIVANTDNTYPTQVPGTTVATTVGNVTTNDTLNGQPVTAANTNVTPITTGPLSIDANGVLTLAPNTVSGTYQITYEICEEGAAPANCATATATVVVGKAEIIALTETTLSINGSIGGTTASLINNDTLNGNAAVISNSPGGVILTAINVPAGLTLNANGTVTVKAGTPIGNYEVEYRICEYLNPSNCASVKSYVPVTGAVIKANNDNAGTVDSSKGYTSMTSIFENDTFNGAPFNPTAVILTTVVPNPNLILRADGTIEVKAGTPSGSYELTYQICEALNPSNCSQAVARISVVTIIDPNPPIPFVPIVVANEGVINVDGINGSLEFINVLDNDLLKGLPVNLSDVVLTYTSTSPYFEFNADGTVSVKPNTPGGNYAFNYRVCEKANPTNCDDGTLTVFVEVPAIAVIKTAVFNDENGSGFANAGETITYKFKVTNTGNVPLKGVMISDPLPGVVLSGQPIDLNVNESDEHSFIATYKIKQTDINKGSVSNQASVQGKSGKGVVVEDKSDDESNLEDKPTVLPLSGCVIKVFNAFSPNGDDKNSRFYIQGLECYPDNTVEIYNRWGVLVYNIDQYNNEDRAFKGFSEGRTTIKQSEGLPVGTYFYILKYKDNESNPHEQSGYLYINK